MSTKTDTPVVILKGKSNWSVWKFRTSILLAAKGCMDVVNEEFDPEGKPKKAFDAWQKHDFEARDIIANRMEDGPVKHILLCNTAYEMWQKLLAIYEQKSEVSLYKANENFMSYKYEHKGIAHHITTIEYLANELSEAGDTVSDSMLISKVLMTLPKEYRHFVSAWGSTDKEKQTLTELTARLLIEEGMWSKPSTGSDESAALSATSDNGAKGSKYCTFCKVESHWNSECMNKSNGDPGVMECFYCKKPGHMKKDCRILKAKEEKKKKSGSANVAEAFITLALCNSETVDSDKWYLDSGASEHMTGRREWFQNFKPFQSVIKIGDGSVLMAQGIGDIRVKVHHESGWVETCILNVLFVPDLKMNLFSVSATMDKGFTLKGDKDRFYLLKNGGVYATAVRQDKLFALNFQTVCEAQANAAVGNHLMVWHQKLAHQNVNHIRKTLKDFDINFVDNKDFFCGSCMEGKQHRLPFSRSTTKSEHPCQLLHIDVAGPMEVESIGGSRYFLLIKDDYSYYRTAFFMERKSEVVEHLKIFLLEVKNVTGHAVTTIRTDNGTEEVNERLKSFLLDQGIRHEKTVPYTPEQNSKVEREMRTVVEAARTMLQAGRLGKEFWAEAVNSAIFVLNRSGTSSIPGKTPFELWCGKMPNLKFLKVFGAEAYSHIPKEKRRKWDSKSKRGIFVGYDDKTKGYRIYNPEDRKMFIARDVIFRPPEESSFPERRMEEDDKHFEFLKCEGDFSALDPVLSESTSAEAVPTSSGTADGGTPQQGGTIFVVKESGHHLKDSKIMRLVSMEMGGK